MRLSGFDWNCRLKQIKKLIIIYYSITSILLKYWSSIKGKFSAWDHVAFSAFGEEKRNSETRLILISELLVNIHWKFGIRICAIIQRTDYEIWILECEAVNFPLSEYSAVWICKSSVIIFLTLSFDTFPLNFTMLV